MGPWLKLLVYDALRSSYPQRWEKVKSGAGGVSRRGEGGLRKGYGGMGVPGVEEQEEEGEGEQRAADAGGAEICSEKTAMSMCGGGSRPPPVTPLTPTPTRPRQHLPLLLLQARRAPHQA